MYSNSETKTHFRFVSVNEEGMMGVFFCFLKYETKNVKTVTQVRLSSNPAKISFSCQEEMREAFRYLLEIKMLALNLQSTL